MRSINAAFARCIPRINFRLGISLSMDWAHSSFIRLFLPMEDQAHYRLWWHGVRSCIGAWNTGNCTGLGAVVTCEHGAHGLTAKTCNAIINCSFSSCNM